MNPVNASIEIIASFIGTLGFGILFNIRGKKLWYAALGGLLSWAIFLALGFVISGEPVRYLIVAIVTTIYSELMARALKTPASTFCIITLIPLVPGGSLYYTMTYALRGNLNAFISKAVYTIQLTVALALGIVIVISADKFISARIRKLHEVKNDSNGEESV